MSRFDTRSSGPGTLHLLRELERRAQGAALRSLGLTPGDRESVVQAMFLRRHRDAVSYWLQLLLSMGIATVGLVLGSTAVVIGAMLIAPLMGPIVELGMALVIGSPVLTIRSFGRLAGSVAAVVGGAALLTLLLPFQEITAEISSRTFPTALDLLLAIFVALAAAFTTVRSSSETTSAAAGTAIGIALVPPLCVMGFGLGIRSADVAGGSTLLFVTNLTAILFISVLFFWALGFETVDTAAWEEEALAEARPGGLVQRAVQALRGVFGSRYGRVLRVAFPMVLVGTVIVPLSRALDQVAWEVRARSAVSRILERQLKSRNAVQSMVNVKQGTVATQLYLVGSTEDASTLEESLLTEIAAATGVVPAVRVVAVPDLRSMRQSAVSQEVEPQLPPMAHLPEIRQQLAGVVQGVWPAAELGPMLGWHLEVQDSAAARLVIRYLGEPGGAAVEQILSRTLSERIGTALVVRTRAYRPEEAAEPGSRGTEWLPELLRAFGEVRETKGLYACVKTPDERRLARDASLRRIAGLVRAEAERMPPGRVTVEPGESRWSVRLAPQPCTAPAEAAPAEG